MEMVSEEQTHHAMREAQSVQAQIIKFGCFDTEDPFCAQLQKYMDYVIKTVKDLQSGPKEQRELLEIRRELEKIADFIIKADQEEQEDEAKDDIWQYLV